MYIKEDGKIYKITTTRELINLDALKAELKDLKEMEAPSDEELIELGRPYSEYHDKDIKVDNLTDQIAEIEKQVEEK